MSTSPCSAPSTTASWPRELMNSIDWGLTETPVVPPSEIVRGENPPATENFHARSRAVSVWAPEPDIGSPHPAHVTYEKFGLRIASGSLRPIAGGWPSVDGPASGASIGAHAGGVDHGTSKDRALSSESAGSQES